MSLSRRSRLWARVSGWTLAMALGPLAGLSCDSDTGSGGRDDAGASDAGDAGDAGDSGPDFPKSEQGWAMYGHDLSNSQSYDEATRLTSDSVKKLAPKWRVRVGGGATSTPVVVDGTAYFGAWDGHFYAVDSATGELQWKQLLGRSFIRSTPLVTEDRIYVAFDRSLAALSRRDGEPIFKHELLDHPQGFLDASPKLADGVVVLGIASFELNLMRDDYTFEGAVLGIDADSGDVLWRVPVTGENDGICQGGAGVSVWSTAAIDRELGLAYVGTGQTYQAPASTCNDSLLAIHYKRKHKGERIAWKATYTKDDVYVAAGSGIEGLDHDIGAGPNLFDAGDVAAVGVGDKGGTYRAFNRATGKKLWRADLDAGTLAQLGGVMTTAAVYDDKIFVTSNHWMVFGFIVSGEHSPADTATLYALDTESGEVVWEKALKTPVFGSFAVADGVLYQPNIRGEIFARDTDTGKELWKASIDAPIGAGLSLTHDGLFASGGFTLNGHVDLAHVVAFGIDGDNVVEHDLRVDDFRELSEAECSKQLESQHSDEACRDCLCQCDATATGSCQEACWEQASCVVDNCAEVDFEEMGVFTECYDDACTTKLLPSSVYRESVSAAACIASCADVCSY